MPEQQTATTIRPNGTIRITFAGEPLDLTRSQARALAEILPDGDVSPVLRAALHGRTPPPDWVERYEGCDEPAYGVLYRVLRDHWDVESDPQVRTVYAYELVDLCEHQWVNVGRLDNDGPTVRCRTCGTGRA